MVRIFSKIFSLEEPMEKQRNNSLKEAKLICHAKKLLKFAKITAEGS